MEMAKKHEKNGGFSCFNEDAKDFSQKKYDPKEKNALEG